MLIALMQLRMGKHERFFCAFSNARVCIYAFPCKQVRGILFFAAWVSFIHIYVAIEKWRKTHEYPGRFAIEMSR